MDSKVLFFVHNKAYLFLEKTRAYLSPFGFLFVNRKSIKRIELITDIIRILQIHKKQLLDELREYFVFRTRNGQA